MSALSRLAARSAPGPAGAFPWAAPDWPVSVARPVPERHVGVDYDTAWSRRYGARLVRAVTLDAVVRPLTHVMASPEVRGAEILALVEAPAIYVANHASHVDTPLVLSVLPTTVRHRRVVAAAADHFFDRRWKAHLWALMLAAIPIERHRVNRRSADTAAALIEEGWNLVLYPEGSRTPDGWFQELRGGAAYLASRTGRPVVPMHIDGTFRILPRGGERLRRNPTRITFGTPLTLRDGEDARRLEGAHRRYPVHAGRRGPHRLVDRAPAGGGRTDPFSAGTRRVTVASRLGPRSTSGRGRSTRRHPVGTGRRLNHTLSLGATSTGGRAAPCDEGRAVRNGQRRRMRIGRSVTAARRQRGR